MKFAEVIQAAGNNPENFPNAAELDIVLLNAKQHEFEGDKLEFDESHPIFAKNPAERSKFEHFLDRLESGLEGGSISADSLYGRLTIDTLVVTHFRSFSEVFFR